MPEYREDWADMSNYLVHFTKDSDNKSAYHHIMNIWGGRELFAANPYGVARNLAPSTFVQNVVCFSEVPLHLLQRISERRSKYGIGFTKEFILDHGGASVWYLETNSSQANYLNCLLEVANRNEFNELSNIWRLTPFIDYLGDYDHGSYRFEWEREWRIVGNMQFEENDVAFLVLPEEEHRQARIFFEDAIEENIGPGYLCPYIDPSWDQERIREVMRTESLSL